MDRPSMKVRNPIGPDRPVYVHEQVWEKRPMLGSKRTVRVLIFNPGDWITLDEAERYDVPMIDDKREPVPGAKPQKPKPDVETQEVRGPRQRESAIERRRRAQPRRKPKPRP